ncbi:adp-ribosylation factor gtpase- [Stylonychia lemnae]|uniref:Adp-ribosylation factor gtpase n=1 Tax=Stylonychia lemnae TaxID=5949 RepID=A0A078APV4_STYLE|nr:adp-ribosylation factor gtpase- [Stylonychia lemnae]|eukprot:CDW82973.1 adp-ribosylation factor gtpase- [Stylonychia lemnae]
MSVIAAAAQIEDINKFSFLKKQTTQYSARGKNNSQHEGAQQGNAPQQSLHKNESVKLPQIKNQNQTYSNNSNQYNSSQNQSINTIDCKIAFKDLMSQYHKDNSRCFDCGGNHPSWVSVNLGIFLCLNCAGQHRGYGVQISFMRSVLMDKLTKKQLKLLNLAGNQRLHEFFEQYDLNKETPNLKYKSKAAQYYRELLQCECAERQLELVQPEYNDGRQIMDSFMSKDNKTVLKPQLLIQRKRSFDSSMNSSKSIPSNMLVLDQDCDPIFNDDSLMRIQMQLSNTNSRSGQNSLKQANSQDKIKSNLGGSKDSQNEQFLLIQNTKLGSVGASTIPKDSKKQQIDLIQFTKKLNEELAMRSKKLAEKLEEQKISERASELAQKSYELSKEIYRKASDSIHSLNDSEKIRMLRKRTNNGLDSFGDKLDQLKNSIWSFMTEACSGRACPHGERPSTMLKMYLSKKLHQMKSIYELDCQGNKLICLDIVSMGAQLGNDYVEPSRKNTNAINLNNALDYYGSVESRYDFQNKLSDEKMPPRTRVQSEFNVLDYFQEKSFQLNSLRRPTMHKFGRQNKQVKEIEPIQKQATLINQNQQPHETPKVITEEGSSPKAARQQKLFSIKGKDHEGVIKDVEVVQDHFDREFQIPDDIELDDYTRKMTYDNLADCQFYKREDLVSIESNLRFLRNAQLENGISNRTSCDLLTRSKPKAKRHRVSSQQNLDNIEEEQLLQEFENPLQQPDINDCLSYTKSADDQIQENLEGGCDVKDIQDEFVLQYTNHYEQMSTVGGLTESPSKNGQSSNHGDLFSEFQINASNRNRSFSQETELITVTGHEQFQRKNSLMFIECEQVNEQIDRMERNSVGNRSLQPEILDDHNQIQLPDDLADINFLDRVDKQTEVAIEDLRDQEDAIPVPNDEIEPPPSARKVEVFDDHILHPLSTEDNYSQYFYDDQDTLAHDIQVKDSFQNSKILRLKYLSKLAKEQVWLPPMKQPKQNQNLVILDWDDTIFPTSHLNPVDESQYDFLLEKYQKYLTEIEEQAIKLFQSCTKQCKVVIITNAKKGWVEFSSRKFMPNLHNFLMKYVKIVSARVDYEEQYPMDTYKWKQLAFQKLWECKDLQLDKAAITNLITFGDSEYEMEAARKFGARSEKCFVKLIKLRECPSFDELHKELLVINERFNYIFSSYKNLTIRLEKQFNSFTLIYLFRVKEK